MKYDIQVIRDALKGYESTAEFKYVIRGASLKYQDYGRVFGYVLDETGAIKTFKNEGDAWAWAAKLSRGSEA